MMFDEKNLVDLKRSRVTKNCSTFGVLDRRESLSRSILKRPLINLQALTESEAFKENNQNQFSLIGP